MKNRRVGSYILVHRETNTVAMEILNPATLAKVNHEVCEVIPIMDYLVSLNEFIYDWETGGTKPNPAYRVYGKKPVE